MIKAKAELFNGGCSVQLEVKGSTKDLLLELKSVCVGTLSSMGITRKGESEELPLDERIKLFCKLLSEEDEGDGEQED